MNQLNVNREKKTWPAEIDVSIFSPRLFLYFVVVCVCSCVVAYRKSLFVELFFQAYEADASYTFENSLQLIRSQCLIARNRSYFNILMPFARSRSLNVPQSCLKCSAAFWPFSESNESEIFPKSSIYFILTVVDLCYLLPRHIHSRTLSIHYPFHTTFTFSPKVQYINFACLYPFFYFCSISFHTLAWFVFLFCFSALFVRGSLSVKSAMFRSLTLFFSLLSTSFTLSIEFFVCSVIPSPFLRSVPLQLLFCLPPLVFPARCPLFYAIV